MLSFEPSPASPRHLPDPLQTGCDLSTLNLQGYVTLGPCSAASRGPLCLGTCSEPGGADSGKGLGERVGKSGHWAVLPGTVLVSLNSTFRFQKRLE